MLAPLGVVQVIELSEFTILGAIHGLALDAADAAFCIDGRGSGEVLFEHLRRMRGNKKYKRTIIRLYCNWRVGSTVFEFVESLWAHNLLFFLAYFLSFPGNGEKLPLLIDTECAIDMTSDIRTLLHHCSPP